MTIAKTPYIQERQLWGRPAAQGSSLRGGVELVVIRSGDVVTLYPAATSIPEMIARLNALPRPPSIEERDDEELPERAGFWLVVFLLDDAATLTDVDLPGFGFHALKGDRRGQYAVTITRNWRVTFRWKGEDAIDVGFEDYHGE